MSYGVLVSLYLARGSAVLYAATIWLLLRGPMHDFLARIAWTLGCALLWAHAGCAFAFLHHWSNAEAYRFTAEQTRRITGLDWGSGLYLNYACMLLWAVDCVSWWIAGAGYHGQSRVPRLAFHAFLAFMMINATVIFARGLTRYVAIAVLVGLLVQLTYFKAPLRPAADATA